MACRDPCGSRGSKLKISQKLEYHLRRDPCGSRGSKFPCYL